MEHSKSLPQDAVKRSNYGKGVGVASSRGSFRQELMKPAALGWWLPYHRCKSEQNQKRAKIEHSKDKWVARARGVAGEGVCQSNPCPTNPLLIKDCLPRPRPHRPCRAHSPVSPMPHLVAQSKVFNVVRSTFAVDFACK